MLTHEDVPNLAGLKGKTIFVATAGRSNWWPWLKGKYGYAEEQTRPYTFNPQPFVADPNSAMQAYMSSEPLAVQNLGVKAKFHLFAHDGYPPYGTTIVTTKKMVDERADVVQRFVRASIEGWKSYLANPGLANELIKRDNPNMKDEQIAFAIAKLKENKLLDGGDAGKLGLGIMTDERWKATYDTMVKTGLLKPEVDWKAAYTTRFVKDLKVMP
jgi:NitT/TauT family transport system substrate-binding protein